MCISFRFRWIAFLAMVLLVTLGIRLGQWQAGKAEQKIALQARLTARQHEAPLQLGPSLAAPGALEYRRVRVTGQFVRDWPVYLDNRPYQGRAGFYVLMPLCIAGSNTCVLVARGWLPRSLAERDRVPSYATPQGPVTVEGMAKTSLGHVMELGAAPPLKPGAIVQNMDVTTFAAAAKLTLQPFVIEQAGPAAPGEALVRDWPAPSLGVERNQGYALQWYALAAMAFLFFVVTGFRREPRQPAV
jgi:surfeit locus 1 family protein